MSTKFKTRAENLRQWKWEEEPVLTGQFVEKITITPENADPFDLFKFALEETGELVTVPSNYTVAHELSKMKDEDTDFETTLIRITYLGSSIVKGKPFKKFRIETAEMEEPENVQEETKTKRTKKN